jgi:UvrD/REP helicase N-terminal domain
VLATVAALYLEMLNPEHRRAVEQGIAAHGHVGAPLLVIAGAGSGKTNTLAHRVAHLIVNGADPRRILLMTFSRRAAAEMTKRVERIARKVMSDNAGVMTDALAWSGTFHGIGARLLRDASRARASFRTGGRPGPLSRQAPGRALQARVPASTSARACAACGARTRPASTGATGNRSPAQMSLRVAVESSVDQVTLLRRHMP